MKTTDWKDALGALLPDHYVADPTPEPQPQKRPWPKLTVTLDRKRAGKTATIISGFDPDDERAARLANDLKKLLATGGSTRGGEILLQGDRVEAVNSYLKKVRSESLK